MQKSFLILPLFLLSFFPLFISTLSQADQRVSAIQNMLKNQGYDIGVIDGKAGKNTLIAVTCQL